jgi:hypothetical protein
MVHPCVQAGRGRLERRRGRSEEEEEKEKEGERSWLYSRSGSSRRGQTAEEPPAKTSGGQMPMPMTTVSPYAWTVVKDQNEPIAHRSSLIADCFFPPPFSSPRTMPITLDFTGKLVLVTGGGRGIGAAISKALAKGEWAGAREGRLGVFGSVQSAQSARSGLDQRGVGMERGSPSRRRTGYAVDWVWRCSPAHCGSLRCGLVCNLVYDSRLVDCDLRTSTCGL